MSRHLLQDCHNIRKCFQSRPFLSNEQVNECVAHKVEQYVAFLHHSLHWEWLWKPVWCLMHDKDHMVVFTGDGFYSCLCRYACRPAAS